MCCGSGNRFNGTSGVVSGAWGSSATPTPDGPWEVTIPKMVEVNGQLVQQGTEIVEAETYAEANQIVHARRGSGLRRKKTTA